MLSLLKLLLGIADDSKNELLTHFLEQAANAACSYCNVDVLPERYSGAVVDLAAYLYVARDSANLKTKTQGERTVGYFEAVDIPEQIKAALPLPRVRVIGHV